MFDSFTEEAREVLVASMREANLLKHGWTGTEHLLLGLLNDPEVAVVLGEHGIDLLSTRARVKEICEGHERFTDEEALATLGIDLEAVRASADAAFGPGSFQMPANQPAFTPRAARAIDSAAAAAADFGEAEVDRWHLALGLLWPNVGGIARDVVAEHAGGVDAVIESLERRAERNGPPDARPTVNPEDVIAGMPALQQAFSLGGGPESKWIHPQGPPLQEVRDRVRAGASVLVDAREAGDLLTRYVDAARGFAAALDLVMWPLDKGIYLLHPRDQRVDQATRRKILGL